MKPSRGTLHVLRSGQLRLRQPNVPTLEIREPSLLFLPRPQAHRFEVDYPQCAALVCASIDLGAGTGNPMLRGMPDLLVVRLTEMTPLDAALDLLFTEAAGGLSGSHAALNRLAEYILLLLLRHALSAKLIDGGLLAVLADPQLRKSATAMHERPDHDWTLEGLAQLAGMSRARFAAHFRDIAGTTPLSYLTDWRISVAQALLKGGKRVKLVAPLVGYSSDIAFARVFARRIGVGPAEWLAQCRAAASA